MIPEAETQLAATGSPPPALKPPVPEDALLYRQLVEGPFWQRIPAYAQVSEADFLDHGWQARHSITNAAKLLTALKGLVTEDFLRDAEAGFRQAPMSVRVSPYLLSLVDWTRPYEDPLRLQFIPVASRRLPDHPKLNLDSLHERQDMPVPGLTHRYPDKALFLALDTCPVYCRFCTRSYAVGIDTEEVTKFHLRVNPERWQATFAYIDSRPELEDIVISGGDAYQLRPEQITHIGESLLAIPHVRRFRYATKGLAVMPQKILTDNEWTDALSRIVEKGRSLHKEVVIHTHFNHPNEITGLTRAATDKLCERGITVRNQSVLQRAVNDAQAVQVLLSKRLSYVNVHPYYIYMHDLVMGVEDLRTTLETGLHIEKALRGVTSGFNTPLVVVDAPGGGGKRDAHSYEHYNRVTGVSVFTSPAVKRGQLYFYFDPIDLLPEEGRRRWADPAQHEVMIDEARTAAERGTEADMSDGCTSCGRKGGCDHRKAVMFAAIDEALARLYPSRRWDEWRDDLPGSGIAPALATSLCDRLAERLSSLCVHLPGSAEEYCSYLYVLCTGRQPALIEVREGCWPFRTMARPLGAVRSTRTGNRPGRSCTCGWPSRISPPSRRCSR